MLKNVPDVLKHIHVEYRKILVWHQPPPPPPPHPPMGGGGGWKIIFSKYQNFEEKLLLSFYSTFYESNNGVIGILVSKNMKNDSLIMFIPYLVAKIC